ncbi:hypothetical protein [Los Azufres archaeal virus 1]|nr:hypothetical protein [Los Azufres archaeal virus 1]
MPAGWIHEMLEKGLLGYSNKNLQKLMDSAWTKKGIYHREFGHDLQSILLLSVLAGGDIQMNVLQGLLHVMVDDVGTRTKRKFIQSGISPELADVLLYYYFKPLKKSKKRKK